MKFDDIPEQPLTQEQVMEMVAAANARKSKMLALVVALAAHLGLIGILVLIVFGEPLTRPPNLIISAPYSPVEELAPQKKQLAQIQSRQPAAPSAAMAKVVTAAAISPIPVPEVEDFVENPVDLGAGFGEGLGSGMGFGGGAGQGGSFFGTPAVGKSVILVIDVSTSMPRLCGENGIAAIRREIARTVNAFRPGTMFNLICFGNMADGFRPRPVPASGPNKMAAILFTEDYFTGKFQRTRTAAGIDPKGEIDYVQIRPDDFEDTEDTSGGSRYDMALIAAFQQQPETVFLLTDGEPSTSRDGERLSKNDILRMVRKAGRGIDGTRPKVNCISVNGIGKSYLRDIAQAFRGKYTEIEPSKM